ncbi:hypothetical protein M422DRAFT_246881 [Sphaerobolus stellatus SS14]|nr:hypothetical protein M422DRAFT_246881 [Sphaerobolus stellatus SS14]
MAIPGEPGQPGQPAGSFKLCQADQLKPYLTTWPGLTLPDMPLSILATFSYHFLLGPKQTHNQHAAGRQANSDDLIRAESTVRASVEL